MAWTVVHAFLWWRHHTNPLTTPELYPKASPALPEQLDHQRQLSEWPPPDGQDLPQRLKDCQQRHQDIPQDAQ